MNLKRFSSERLDFERKGQDRFTEPPVFQSSMLQISHKRNFETHLGMKTKLPSLWGFQHQIISQN